MGLVCFSNKKWVGSILVDTTEQAFNISTRLAKVGFADQFMLRKKAF